MCLKALRLLTLLQPEDTQHTHLAVPVPSLRQEPPRPAAFAKCSGASYYPGCTSAPPPQQLCGQLSPPVPSPTLLISLKSCVIQPSGELETIHSDLSPFQPGWQLPEDMSAALCWEKSHILRFVFLKQLAQEQLETLARCVASGPPRASLPGCSVTHGDPSSPSKQNSTRLQESLCSNFRELLSSAVTTS